MIGAQQKKIKVTIDPLGQKPVVEAVGFNGAGCLEATKAVENALGGTGGGVERVYKPEYDSTITEPVSTEASAGMRW